LINFTPDFCINQIYSKPKLIYSKRRKCNGLGCKVKRDELMFEKDYYFLILSDAETQELYFDELEQPGLNNFYVNVDKMKEEVRGKRMSINEPTIRSTYFTVSFI